MRYYFLITLLVCSLSAGAQTIQEWRDSISYLSQLIEQHPKDLELRMRKAECNMALEQWSYAMDEYTRIIEMYPNHLGATYFRGFANYKLRRYSFARIDYENVLHFEPRHLGAMMGLIRTNLADGMKQKAYDEANLLVDMYPDTAKVYVFRAEVEDAMGMTDFAIDDISKAVDLLDRHIGINQRLYGDEEYTTTVIRRMELYRKKDTYSSLQMMNADREMLVRKGIPSSRLRSFELKAKKKKIKN